MAEAESRGAAPATDAPGRRGRGVTAALLAWLVPGSGHLYLGRWGRAAVFFVLVVGCVVVGVALDGRLWWFGRGAVVPPVPGAEVDGGPLTFLASLVSIGLGVPAFVLRFLLDYRGDITAAGYEYGTTFLLTAGLMNLLLVLDAWDVGRGVKG